MKTKILATVVAVGCLLLGSVQIGHAMTLTIVPQNQYVMVLLANDDVDPVFVYKWFPYGSLPKTSVIYINIRDSGGNPVEMRARIEPAIIRESDYVEQGPGDVIGRAIRWKTLKRQYDLKPGKYSLSVDYLDSSPFRSKSFGKLTSNKIHFQLEENMEVPQKIWADPE